MNTLDSDLAASECLSAFGLYSAYCLDNPTAPVLSKEDQVRWIVVQYEKPGWPPVLDWAEICAQAIRGETERKIETLSGQEQFEIAAALIRFVEILEEMHDDYETLEELAELRALAEEFAG